MLSVEEARQRMLDTITASTYRKAQHFRQSRHDPR